MVKTGQNMGVFQANPYFLETSKVVGSVDYRWVFYAPLNRLDWLIAPSSWNIGDRGYYVQPCALGMWWRCFRGGSSIHARTSTNRIEHKTSSNDQPTCHCSVCPEGMVCPDGIHANVCPDGTYSAIKTTGKNQFYSECTACPPGSRCPKTTRMTAVIDAKKACMVTFMKHFNLNAMYTNTDPTYWNPACDTYFNVEDPQTYTTGLSSAPIACGDTEESLYVETTVSNSYKVPFQSISCTSKCTGVKACTKTAVPVSILDYYMQGTLRFDNNNNYLMYSGVQRFFNEIHTDAHKDLINVQIPFIVNKSCINCPAGQTGENSICVPCKIHTFSNIGTNGACQNCDSDQFTVGTGSTSCSHNTVVGQYIASHLRLNCAANQRAVIMPRPGQMGCLECDAGKQPQLLGVLSTLDNCVNCGKGMVRDLGEPVCRYCGIGKYIDTTSGALNTCVKCSSGQYSVGTSDANTIDKCNKCTDNFAAINAGQTACDIRCVHGNERCRNSDDTTKQNIDKSLNANCLPSGQTCGCYMMGLYLNGSGHCLICPAGYYCTGNSLATPCAIGKFSVFIGLSADSCTTCERGTYTDKPGQVVCLPCKPGHRCQGYNPLSGGVVALDGQMVACTMGTYQPNASQGECLTCQNGTYQNNSNATECKTCAGATLPGASSCTPCVDLQTFYDGSGYCRPCTNSGGEGKKVLALCTASKKHGDTVFTPCANSCPTVDYYLSGPVCPGNTTVETRTCARCTQSCGEGYYQSRICDNTVGTNRVCAQCNRTLCPSTHYRLRYCNGDDTSDVSECRECTKICAIGQYKYTSSCGPDATQDNVCKGCISKCDPGNYIAGTCLGNSTMDTSVCVPCTKSCASGSYLSGNCDGTTRTNVQCVPCYTQENCNQIGTTQGKTLWMHLPPSKCNGNGTEGSVCRECYNSSCAGGSFVQNTCQAVGENVKTDDCVLCTTQCQPGEHSHPQS